MPPRNLLVCVQKALQVNPICQLHLQDVYSRILMVLPNYTWQLHTTSFISVTDKKGIFIIQSESLKKCIQVGPSVLTLEDCKQPNENMLWKWVSYHRLFNLGGSGCLGLNLSNPEQPLGIYECDSTDVSLRWHCSRKMIVGPLQYMVQVEHDNTVMASWKHLHKWVSYMSGGGDICEHLHTGKNNLNWSIHGMVDSIPWFVKHYMEEVHQECQEAYGKYILVASLLMVRELLKS